MFSGSSVIKATVVRLKSFCFLHQFIYCLQRLIYFAEVKSSLSPPSSAFDVRVARADNRLGATTDLPGKFPGVIFVVFVKADFGWDSSQRSLLPSLKDGVRLQNPPFC